MSKKEKSAFKLDSLGSRGASGPDYPITQAAREAVPSPGKAISWQKNLSAFALAGLFVASAFYGLSGVSGGKSLKKEILGASSIGYEFLNQAKDELLEQNVENARDGFFLAGESFKAARRDVAAARGLAGLLINILPQGRDLNLMLESASLVGEALVNLTEGLDEFSVLNIDWRSQTNSSGPGFFSGLRASRESFIKAREQLAAATGGLEKINRDNLPEEYRRDFSKSLAQLNLTNAVLGDLIKIQNVLVRVLGGENKRYLVVFQNNDELRASGGFIGTYGVLEFQNGQLRLEKIESIYQLAGQLNQNIAPPVPIARLLNDRFNIQDSNWFVDFPASARKILEFYETATGSLADGVIAVTPDVFEGLLGIAGPIAMDEYGEVLTKENFRERVQIRTSLEYDKALNQPKKLLSDFAPRLLAGISKLSGDEFLPVFDILSSMVSQKQILVFSLDEYTQAAIADAGMSGEIKKAAGDYFAVFHSSVGGGKTSMDVDSKVNKKVEVSPEGEALVTLWITRAHRDFEEKFFPRNVDFMRVLIPPDSELVEVSGFDEISLASSVRPGYLEDADVKNWQSEITPLDDGAAYIGREAGYRVVSGWLELDPGESRTIQIKYRLGSKIERLYTNLLQKQPGARSFDFTLEIKTPGAPVFVYPERAVVRQDGATISEIVNSDRFQAVIFD